MDLRPILLVLLGLVVAVEARLLLDRGPAVLLVAPDTAVPTAPVAPELESAFTAHMTADDVARGIYALAAPGTPLPLSETQAATIGPLLTEGAALREQLGELRMARRAHRDAYVADMATLLTEAPSLAARR